MSSNPTARHGHAAEKPVSPESLPVVPSGPAQGARPVKLDPAARYTRARWRIGCARRWPR